MKDKKIITITDLLYFYENPKEKMNVINNAYKRYYQELAKNYKQPFDQEPWSPLSERKKMASILVKNDFSCSRCKSSIELTFHCNGNEVFCYQCRKNKKEIV